MTVSTTTTRSNSFKSNGGRTTNISRTRNGKTIQTTVQRHSFSGNGGKTTQISRLTNSVPKQAKPKAFKPLPVVKQSNAYRKAPANFRSLTSSSNNSRISNRSLSNSAKSNDSSRILTLIGIAIVAALGFVFYKGFAWLWTKIRQLWS